MLNKKSQVKLIIRQPVTKSILIIDGKEVPLTSVIFDTGDIVILSGEFMQTPSETHESTNDFLLKNPDYVSGLMGKVEDCKCHCHSEKDLPPGTLCKCIKNCIHCHPENFEK